MPAGKRLFAATAALAACLPAAAGAETRIAYSSLSSFSHLYVMNGNGAEKTRLTSGSVNDFDAVFSPAGRLVFVRGTSNRSDDLFRLEADGTDLTRLTRTPAAEANPIWSPLGGRLAFEYGGALGSTEIVVTRADGNGRRRLTRNSVDDVAPTWSPDGARLAFTRYIGGLNAEIYSVRADGTRLRRLTSGPAADIDPDWSSRGRIAFVRRRGNGHALVVMNADGSGARALWRTPRPLGRPVWSPGGAHIALELFDGNDTELYVVSATGSVRRLTNNRVDDYAPVWAPGGGRLAFTRYVSGSNDVFVTMVNGTRTTRVAGSAGHEFASDWATVPGGA